AFGGALRQTAWQSAATPSKPARTSRPAITSAPNSVAPSQIARGLFDPAARAAHSAHTSVHATPIGRSASGDSACAVTNNSGLIAVTSAAHPPAIQPIDLTPATHVAMTHAYATAGITTRFTQATPVMPE